MYIFRLLSKHCLLLGLVQQHLKVEFVIGMNGCIWVSSDAFVHQLIIRNLLVASEFMNDSDIEQMLHECTDLHLS